MDQLIWPQVVWWSIGCRWAIFLLPVNDTFSHKWLALLAMEVTPFHSQGQQLQLPLMAVLQGFLARTADPVGCTSPLAMKLLFLQLVAPAVPSPSLHSTVSMPAVVLISSWFDILFADKIGHFLNIYHRLIDEHQQMMVVYNEHLHNRLLGSWLQRKFIMLLQRKSMTFEQCSVWLDSITYISKKGQVIFWIMEMVVLLATDYLEYNDTKAKNIRLHWEEAIQCILGGHITTANNSLLGGDEMQFLFFFPK